MGPKKAICSALCAPGSIQSFGKCALVARLTVWLCTTFPPEGTRIYVRYTSWANDIVPVLLRSAAGEEKRTKGKWRADRPQVHVPCDHTHNGEPLGSRAGHFEAMRKRV